MKIALAKILLKMFGWKYVGETPKIKKAVIIGAPHTSYYDFVWAKLIFVSLGIPAKVLMKKEMFIFPISYILNYMGVVPVNRSSKGNMVEQLSENFKRTDSLYLALSPEGTRKLQRKWKKGFYYIALKAQVPIYCADIDFKNKELFLNEPFFPTGDIDADMIVIKSFYTKSNAKYPKQFTTGL